MRRIQLQLQSCSLISEAIPTAATILAFSHLLEMDNLDQPIVAMVQTSLKPCGMEIEPGRPTRSAQAPAPGSGRQGLIPKGPIQGRQGDACIEELTDEAQA